MNILLRILNIYRRIRLIIAQDTVNIFRRLLLILLHNHDTVNIQDTKCIRLWGHLMVQ